MPMGGNSTGAACGDVKYWPTASAPAGWLKANGAAVSRTTYAALFAVIGTTFGAGDGSATFNLPDLRGEFIRGWDDSRGVDSSRVFGSAQSDDLKSHKHDIPLLSANCAAGVNINGVMNFSGRDSGLTGGAETRPRNVALLACIKY